MVDLDNATEFIEANLMPLCAVSILVMLLLNTIMANVLVLFSKVFFNAMPVEKAFIPARLPHPNEYETSNDTDVGCTPPFEIRLSSATSEQLENFRKFRKLAADAPLVEIARSSALYKGELFDRKYKKFIVEHFGKGREMEFAYPMAHWNGWSGFLTELGPFLVMHFHGYIWCILQHAICGLWLPALLFWTGHPFFYYMSLIIDIGFNMADLLMMWTAAATGAKTGSAFWTLPEHFHLFYAHHIGAISLELMALIFAGREGAWIACFTIVAMLGVTGINLIIFVIWVMIPGQDNKLLTFLVSVGNLMCMIIFRGFAWVYICYEVWLKTVAYAGYWGFVVVVPGLLLFTAFNITLIQIMLKASIKNYGFYIDDLKENKKE